ncbi:hypothetical protein AB0875_12630 [Micromonospora gifhornensis]|uniref:hypothetical protein n=1 Tax=Micromonospora gifhornensis TaxID=84594 RepID=UPI0034571DDE
MTPDARTGLIDTDHLPPTQYLILEVLAARHRLGETTWTFPSRFRAVLHALADAGLIGWKSGVAPRSYIAWLTGAGRSAVLSDTYVAPAGVGRCGQTPPTMFNHAPRPVCALPAGHPGWHRADDGCEWGIAEASQQ